MNIAKNMEAIFVAVIVLAGASNMVNATALKLHAAPAAAPAAALTVASIDANMHTVTVVGKRLSAAEKAVL
ncbi:hypothetical protein [Janthinobacterium agaricidamnosum]|uniref:Uncharacterized protein n=1 Tax=Janthinobacterium agaricidamnosum NBRC 102515 = DSM 9628 TaxID=1349767 RepID=W0V1V9_9BURK|nr:hypothetical protein [Janthinobacterium agaricidamnosum]CDG81323.1 hypothetical protein GJA_664 [Janthinobacterium agaricidamnosum NBRC 102515 = DSM 9628]